MPNITNLTASIGDTCIFPKLNLLKGYFQVPVHPEDGYRYPIQKLCLPILHFWAQEERCHFPEDDGPDIWRTPILHGLHQLHPHFLTDPPETPATYPHTPPPEENGLVVVPEKCLFSTRASGCRPIRSILFSHSLPPTSVKGVQQFLWMIN